MSISKIISGGQTGADQAALNAAILMGLDYGGFLPKGRLTEDGPLPARYILSELSTRSYPKRTEQNVLAADGTAILSHGPLKGGSRLTCELARRHGKPWMHIDFEKVSVGTAALAILDWAGRHSIAVLNVAGSRRSEDPQIYSRTFMAVRGVLTLDLARRCLTAMEARPCLPVPDSLDQAVSCLAFQWPLRLKKAMAGMAPELIDALAAVLGSRIRIHCGLSDGNDALLEDCRARAGRPRMGPADAAGFILEAFCTRQKSSGGSRCPKQIHRGRKHQPSVKGP